MTAEHQILASALNRAAAHVNQTPDTNAIDWAMIIEIIMQILPIILSFFTAKKHDA